MEKPVQKVRLTLSKQAERYASPKAPRETRLMAAKGALPLPPIELATVLFALMHDPDPEVKSTARDSLEKLPEPVMTPVLSGQTHPAILSHLAGHFSDEPKLLEAIALNAATADATIARLAACPHKQIVEIISHNQQRMQRDPDIVEALGSNPLTGRAVIGRILSFLGVEEETDEAGKPETAEAISDDEAEAALRAILGDEFGSLARGLVEEKDGEEEVSEEDLASGNLYSLVQKMSVFQKIQIGRMGNKEARGLLVRDRNKLVAMAVVKSPKITEVEIINFSQSRNVSDEVLRTIAMSKEWTRSYQVKLGLAKNPKCPQALALNFVNYLQDKDLRVLMRSRDVPQVITSHARRILIRKGKI
jgi:hypothetical protein